MSALAFTCVLLQGLNLPVKAEEFDSCAMSYATASSAPAVYNSPLQYSQVQTSALHTSPLQGYLSSCPAYAPFYGGQIHQMNLQYAISFSQSAYRSICGGDFLEAESMLRQSLANNPELIPAHCNLGYILNRTGRAKQALPHLLYAYQHAANEPCVVLTLAASYQLLGQLAAAIQLYNRYLIQFPNAADYAYISDLTRHLVGEANAIRSAKMNLAHDYNWKTQHVRVYVRPADGVRGFDASFNDVLKDSFKSWSDAGVITFSFVSELSEADIECVWVDDASRLSSPGEGGETIIDHVGKTVKHARITLLTQRRGTNSLLTRSEVRALCLHEVGHALGLMEHSLDPSDAMYCTVANAANPSRSDVQHLKLLYTQANAGKANIGIEGIAH